MLKLTRLIARRYQPPKVRCNAADADSDMPEEEVDLGWITQKSKASKTVNRSVGNSTSETASDPEELGENRRRLLKELSARLARDKQMRYAQREFEMQRLMMGKGARKKLRGAEKVEGPSDEEKEDEDEVDARKGKRRSLVQKVDEKTYKPRVYKWRLERKR